MRGKRDRLTEPTAMRVLVVEDNANDVALIKRAFRQCELRPQAFYVQDGEEALDFLRTTDGFEDVPRPDIMITNLNMPKIKGQELLEKMKADEGVSSIPVVILTMSERDEDILKAYSHHAAGYFTKPVDKDQFVSLVQTIHDYWQEALLP